MVTMGILFFGNLFWAGSRLQSVIENDECWGPIAGNSFTGVLAFQIFSYFFRCYKLNLLYQNINFNELIILLGSSFIGE